jgi:hypothetical protein
MDTETLRRAAHRPFSCEDRVPPRSANPRLETLLEGAIEPSAPRVTIAPLSPAGVRKRQIERQVDVD